MQRQPRTLETFFKKNRQLKSITSKQSDQISIKRQFYYLNTLSRFPRKEQDACIPMTWEEPPSLPLNLHLRRG